MELSIPSRIKNYAFRSMAVLVSLLVTAGALEICLRVFGPPYYRFNNQSEEYYTNPRGYHDVIRKEGKHTVFGLRYRDGDHGYRISTRSDQPPVELPDKHVLGLGDSFTYGRGVRYEDIFLTRLEKVLNQGRGRVAVRNCGVVGAGVEDVVNIYARESAALPRGSFVIYGLVLNDFGLVLTEPIRGFNFIDLNNEGYRFSPLRRRSALINFISHSIETRRLHAATVDAYVKGFEGQSAVKGFGLLGQLNQSILKDDGTLLVVVFPLLYDFEKYRFNSIHRKIEYFCDGHRILHLDLLPTFSRHRAEDLWANPTDHHPNEVAHRIAADEIAVFIENELPGFCRSRVSAAP
jgi:hypothetical protein